MLGRFFGVFVFFLVSSVTANAAYPEPDGDCDAGQASVVDEASADENDAEVHLP